MFRQDLWPVQHTHTHTLPHMFSSENRTWDAILAILASCNILQALLSRYSGSHFLFFSLPSPFSTLITSSFTSCRTQSSPLLLSLVIYIFVTAVTWPRWLVPGLMAANWEWEFIGRDPWQAVNSPYATLHTRGKRTLHAELRESTLTQTHQSSAVENFAHYRI